MGRTIEEWQCTPLNCATGSNAIPYTYDLMGDMTSYGNGEGVTLTQTFDGAAHANTLTSSLSDAQHPATMATVAHFFPSGAPELLNLGNGLQEIHIFNSRLQPCRISVTSNAAYPLTIQHCYDNTNYNTLQDLALRYNEGSSDNGNVVAWAGGRPFHASNANDLPGGPSFRCCLTEGWETWRWRDAKIVLPPCL